MAWYDHLWPVLPALLTAAAAFWQFGGLKDSQKAVEIHNLEQAVASAAARKDPLEHGYRAHLLQRLQALHGNRSSAGFLALVWTTSAFMFLTLVPFSKNGTWWGQLIVLGGTFGSMMLAARNFGLYLYSSRTLDFETAQAYELSKVAARQAFVDSSTNLPPLRPEPQLGKQAIDAWKKTTKDKKRNLAIFAGFIAGTIALGLLGYEAWQHDWIEWPQAITVAGWTIAVSLAVLPVWSQTLRTISKLFQPPRIGTTIYWMFQVAWVVLILQLAPHWIEGLVYDAIESDPTVSVKELFILLGTFMGTALLLVWMATSVRVARWAKTRRPPAPTEY